MKTKLFLLACCLSSSLIFTSRIFSQAPDSLWEYHYGGTADDQGFYAIEGQNGEYIVVGKTKSGSHGGYDAYLLKLGSDGSVIWEKSYGGPNNEQIQAICPALNGGYVVTGYVLSDVWLLWVSEEGDSLGSAIYGGPSADQAFCIIPNNDQGYMVTASYGTGFSMGDQVWLMKLDEAGDTLWTRKYGGPSQEYGVRVIQTSDGGYLIAGRSYTTAVPEASDPWAIKTDANGDTIWTHKYGGDDEDNFNCVVETDDGYIFGGITRSFGQGIYSVYAVRTDAKGDTIWTRTYGGTGLNMCYDIDATEDGNFVLSGFTSSFGTSDDLYLLKIDPQGNLLWQASYGHPEADEVFYGCDATSDGGFIATGRTIYFTAYKEEVIVTKLGPPGSGADDPFVSPHSGMTIVPNPAHSKALLKFNAPVPAQTSIEIYNTIGISVKTLVKNEVVSGDTEISFGTGDLKPGLYFIKMMTSEQVRVQKFLVAY